VHGDRALGDLHQADCVVPRVPGRIRGSDRGLPKLSPWFFGRYGDRVIEPEIKIVFAVLLGLMVLADKANSQAVLPAFVLGLGHVAPLPATPGGAAAPSSGGVCLLTPFFFLRGGLNVSLAAVFANLGVLGVLVAAKMIPKLGLIYRSPAVTPSPTRPSRRC